MNAKKLLAIAALLPVTAFAQTAVVPLNGTSAQATNTTCAYISSSLSAPVELRASQNVAAAYQCASTGVATGAAHMQGKKHGYISTSAGGGQTEVTLSANPTSVSDTNGLTSATQWTAAVSSL